MLASGHHQDGFIIVQQDKGYNGLFYPLAIANTRLSFGNWEFSNQRALLSHAYLIKTQLRAAKGMKGRFERKSTGQCHV